MTHTLPIRHTQRINYLLEVSMGKRTVTYSDLSGKELDDPKDTATMTIEFHDKRRGAYCLDITKDEAESFAAKGSKAAAE